MQVSVQVIGIDELKEKLDKLQPRQQVSAVRRALRKAVTPVRNEAKTLAPVADRDVKIGQKAKSRVVEAGHLKKSIAVFTGKSKKWLNVQVGAREGGKGGFDAFYARFVHEGHPTRDKSKKTKPNPFLSKAATTKASEAITIFNNEIDGIIQKIWEKR